jgi:hypothetical protein
MYRGIITEARAKFQGCRRGFVWDKMALGDFSSSYWPAVFNPCQLSFHSSKRAVASVARAFSLEFNNKKGSP